MLMPRCRNTIRKFLPVSLLIAFFFCKIAFAQTSIETVTVRWFVLECDLQDSIPLPNAIVTYEVWTPDPRGGHYSTPPTDATIETNKFGIAIKDFSLRLHRDRLIRYFIEKEEYVPVNGNFILQGDLTIPVCLIKADKLREQRIDSFRVSVDGIVKDDKGQPLKDANIVAEIENGPLLCPQELSDSSGQFSWAFKSSFLGGTLSWKISKEGYFDSKGNFLIDKDKSLYVTLAPIHSAFSPLKKKKSLLRDPFFVVAFLAWTAGVIVFAASQ